MTKCEGFPDECPHDADATRDYLGYQLCEVCAANWREPDHEVAALRQDLANLHDAVDTALKLMEHGDTSAGRALLEQTMKGGKRP